MSVTSWPEPVEDTPTTPRRSRRWLLIGTIVASPLAVVGLVYVISCWRAHSILRQEIARIQQRGEPVWFADLEPKADDEAVARGKSVAQLVNRFDRVPWEFLDDVEKPSGVDAIGLLSGKPLVYEVTADGFAIYDDSADQGRFEVKFASTVEAH